MPNAPITLKQANIGPAINDTATKCNTPEVAVIEGTAIEKELESASSRPSGVLKELALARWRDPNVPASAEERRASKRTPRPER